MFVTNRTLAVQFGGAVERGMVELRVTGIPEVAIHQSSGFSRFTDRLDIPGLGKGLRLRFRLVNTRQAREVVNF